MTPGFDGSGIKIGVIDGGFAGYNRLQSLNELPANIETWWAPSIGNEGTSAHGAACAEIVHDIAPAASLYFANFNTDVEFSDAVDWLISKNVDIISSSMGFFGAGPGDGTGPIDRIIDRRIMPEFSGRKVPATRQNATGVESSTTPTRIKSMSSLSLPPRMRQHHYGYCRHLYYRHPYLERPLGTSANDYDLLLFNNAGSLVAYSANVQNGHSDPYEALQYQVTTAGNYYYGHCCRPRHYSGKSCFRYF